jgi:F420-dependent oxidoreductase-like protein
MWLTNSFRFDAITALAAIGPNTSRMELGTAVVPTFPRHPVVMAQQALTAQDALKGRFTLGIGLSHKVMMEDQLGITYERLIRHMREYLSVLTPLLRGEPVSFHGDLYTAEATVDVPAAAPVPLLVAALGPEMLKLTGRFADGAITSWVGPRTLREHIVPSLAAAANDAGRPTPRVVVGLPIVMTNDPAAARAQVNVQSASYNALPSYRAMFDREGAAGPGDVIIAGSERELDDQLDGLAAAGATDFQAQLISAGPGSVQATVEYLAARAAKG